MSFGHSEALFEAPSWLVDVVRCPRCKGPLSQVAERWHCSRDCGVAPFETADGRPALIDFERSVFERETTLQPLAPGDARTSSRSGPFRNLSANIAANANAELLAKMLKPEKPKALLIGGGEGGPGMETLLRLKPGLQVLNTDVYAGARVHLLADAHFLPLEAGTFDLVIANAVLEHLLEPAAAVDEIWRVLNAGGTVYADTPFLQAVHMGAYDFTRFTPLGHRALFRRFEEVRRGVSVGPMSSLRWAVEYAARCVLRSRKGGWLFRPLTAPLGWLEKFASRPPFALDACSGSYFIGIKAERTLTPKEIIAAYQGGQAFRA